MSPQPTASPVPVGPLLWCDWAKCVPDPPPGWCPDGFRDDCMLALPTRMYSAVRCAQPVAWVTASFAVMLCGVMVLLCIGGFEIRANHLAAKEGETHGETRRILRNFYILFCIALLPRVAICLIFIFNYTPAAFWLWAVNILAIALDAISAVRLMSQAIIQPFVKHAGGAILVELQRSSIAFTLARISQRFSAVVAIVAAFAAAATTYPIQDSIWRIHVFFLGLLLISTTIMAIVRCGYVANFIKCQIIYIQAYNSQHSAIPYLRRLKWRMHAIQAMSFSMLSVFAVQSIMIVFFFPAYWPFILITLFFMIVYRFLMLILFTSVRSRSTWFYCFRNLRHKWNRRRKFVEEERMPGSSAEGDGFESTLHRNHSMEGDNANYLQSEVTVSRILLKFLMTDDERGITSQ